MDFERKSERNQQICEQLKLERKQKARTRPKMPAPRFGPGMAIPEVPEGMELHKFYGQPIHLPKREDGEPLVGKTPYTQRMVDRLNELVFERDHKLLLETFKREEEVRERIGYLGLAF